MGAGDRCPVGIHYPFYHLRGLRVFLLHGTGFWHWIKYTKTEWGKMCDETHRRVVIAMVEIVVTVVLATNTLRMRDGPSPDSWIYETKCSSSVGTLRPSTKIRVTCTFFWIKVTPIYWVDFGVEVLTIWVLKLGSETLRPRKRKKVMGYHGKVYHTLMSLTYYGVVTKTVWVVVKEVEERPFTIRVEILTRVLVHNTPSRIVGGRCHLPSRSRSPVTGHIT